MLRRGRGVQQVCAESSHWPACWSARWSASRQELRNQKRGAVVHDLDTKECNRSYALQALAEQNRVIRGENGANEPDYTLDSDSELYYLNYYYLRGGRRWPPPISPGPTNYWMFLPEYPIELTVIASP